MHLLKVKDGAYQFHLHERDRVALLAMLRRYPVIPAPYHRVARQPEAAPSPDAQRLLEESVAERKREHKRYFESLLTTHLRHSERPPGYRLSLDRGQIEALLQVLNDVRVGSWLKLGAPDPDEGREVVLSKRNAFYAVALTESERFEWALLKAVHGGE